jgi:hypothetical protein
MKGTTTGQEARTLNSLPGRGDKNLDVPKGSTAGHLVQTSHAVTEVNLSVKGKKR